MARISEQTIEHVRSRADILDVVSDYVQLKRRGQNHFGLCPFHNEKTGSFSVNQSKQIYHCFGCGAGGGAINFIMEIEKLNFIDSIKHLGERYGIPVEIEGGSGRPKELIAQISETQNVAVKYFTNGLTIKEGIPVLDYLHKRGLSDDTITQFQLGYSPNSWDGLLNILRKEKFSAEALNQSGLIISSEKGYFDRFRGRVMFTIQNTAGKIVAFAGRVFKGDDPAKYVNSPETPLYIKSNILYGLWATKQKIREEDLAIVVEGYLDFLQLYQSEIQNIVAVSGTAFTDGQARELGKFTRNVALAYDGDKAGISAAIRAGYVLLRNGLSPKIVNLPEGIDPDDWVKDKGSKPLLDAVENADSLLKFHFQHFKGDTSNPSELAKFSNESLMEIAQISDPVNREVYVKTLSEITGLRDATLFESLDTLLKKQRQRQPTQKSDKTKESTLTSKSSRSQRVEDEIIQLCFVKDQTVRRFLYDNLDKEWFSSTTNKRIFDVAFIHLHSEFPPDTGVILDGLTDKNDIQKLSALIFEIEKVSSDLTFAKDCVIRLEKDFISNKLDKLREGLKQNESNNEDVMSIITKISELQKEQNLIRNKYNSNEK
ncbi:MAG: DNA primase [Candidatus Marinimicrobia bacterium]|nr:DNA primase [Candidatus Neomarinimicrobiota bacterium]MBL7022894.1 DNA primase [Candidatus Neomarinimicrobiota bacterium]MBL7109213.1 DNA primase [Candidatus Neomarinimicrobiota bacterium]